MIKHHVNMRSALIAVAAAVALSASAASAASAPETLSFDKVFADAGEPAALHFKADFVSQGASHRMELWRDGRSKLKRRTDDALETYVVRAAPHDAEYSMVVLDLNNKISTRIDRTNLYRVGNFTDWFDLAHGLRHPKGPYQLVRTEVTPVGVQPIASCTWYELRQNQRTVEVCWSGKTRLPLVMLAPDHSVIWRVTDLDIKRPPAAVFAVNDAGFVRNDANADLERD